jgi:mannose-6-phosphate isomerase-like protein (cupin superfamily)
MSAPPVIRLEDKFRLFHDHWSPKVVADLNDAHVKVVKLKGEFVWHHHDAEDELFLVVKGMLRIHFRDALRELRPGDLIVIPRGVEHKPEATEEVHVVLIEPASTLNTGNVREARTVEQPQRI